MFSMVMVYGQCPLPTPVSNPVTVSCGSTATLTASGSSGTYVWFSDAAATQQVATGASYTTPAILANTTYYVRTTSGAAPCNTSSLANILSALNNTQAAISAAVPNGYNFTMDGPNGVNSTYISDGGNDMYDGGNYINTNFGSNLTYSDNLITPTNFFGAGSQFFSRKINNMWVLAADCNNISSFSITGNNGADGGGSYDGTTFNVTVGCQTYKVMLKRVYNAGDPSINQMVIIPNLASATHTWATNTDNTQHDITGLTGTTRLYYLLYASASGGYIDNAAATTIATTFLNQVSATVLGQPACQSSIVAVPVTITTNNPQPVISGTSLVNCNGTSTLTASTGNNTVWYSAAANGSILGTGSSFTTPALMQSTTYYAASATISSATQTFNYTGAQQTWTVPAGVSNITVDVRGAQGAASSWGSGGIGGRTQANLPVVAGSILYLNVGGAGTISAGGWNGGGAPYACSCTGGGGGASDIRIGGTALTDRKIVAGGGGGAGYCYYYCSGDNGGAGGNTTGGPGLSGSSNIPSYGGQGGTQAAGGAGASVGGAAGTLGVGGGNGYYGGGGGGGYYGGGAGYYGGGGGGGSSYTVGTATAVTHTQGFNAGNGQIIITYTIISCASNLASFTVNVNGPAAPTVSGTTTINCGSTTTLTSSTGNNTFWYSAAVGGNLLGTGSTYTTPSLSANTSVFAFAANITSGSQSFTYTGSQQTWTVPAGVTSITVDAQGAQGGTSGYGTGGLGGRLQATLPVTPGATLFINVGGQGNTSVGGWNGGGAPYACGCAAGGGGATDIRIGGTALTDRKIVAGGGGGAGYYWNWLNDHGGVGGGLTGGAGYTNNSLNASYCGQGGTQASGGAGAAIGGPAGTLGTGGGNGYYAGGGGGGYYGGGAGYYGGGGGGGSSFSDATASAVTHTQGFKTGNGLITISWSSPSCFSNAVTTNIIVNPLASPTANPATIGCGLTATLNAVGGGGSYTWYSNSNATGQLGTGASYTTPNLSANTTYYVASTSGLANGTVYTFTNCSATGMYGPTQAQVNSAYTSTNLSGAVTSSSGIQLWTVPTTGMYRIEAFGAQGGGNNNFGRGAQMRGDFSLTAGQQLKIIVGQQGGVQSSGSGGGGSFVATSANVPLIVAGGGGGQYDGGSAIANAHAVTTNNGQNSTCTSGGVAGAGGNGCGSGAAGGGGFNTNGGNGSWGTGGISFVNGGNGGNHSSYAQCVGGFGGGGGTHGNTGGGAGGGGYSGGAGETQTSLAGSGGGSYNNGSNQVNVGGIRTGNGLVTITSLTSPCASATVPVTVTIAPLSAPTVNGTTVNCGQTPTLTASNNLGGIIWYSNAAGSTQVGTGGSFTVPALSATTTYYVGAGTGACATALTPVTVTVNPPANPTASASLANVNCGQTSVLTAQGGNIYTWYSNAAGTTIVGTGASFTTPGLSANTTYYVASSTSQGSGSQTFNYTGAVQTFTAPVTATYTLEAWGAKGGGGTNCYGAGGNGGYSKGSITLTAGQTIYIGVGQQGYQSSSATAFNGGGAGNANPGDPGYTGGGATHFATANGVLASLSGNQNSVLLVAGGGGGAAGGTCVCSYQGNGGVGGGSTGGTGVCSGNDCGYRPAGSGGTQAAGGTSQSPSIASAFGLGATSSTNTGDCIQGGGGGGGWYGGGAGGYAGGGGGGGSGYLNASLAVTQLTDGASSMPNPAGGLMTGNAGNGVAVISWVGVACQSALIPVSITINAPASPNVSGTTTINCGSSTVLTSSAGNSTAWYSAAVGGTLLGTGSTYTTPVLAAGTSVYAMAATIASGNQTFNYTGAQQTWTVPAGVTSITVDAQGAQGSNSSYGTGGNGGRVQTTLSVTPGATVYINVGQAGTISAGGWNGGGAPYACSCAGGGGGASDLRIGGTALTDRKIVAGGGGGAGYCWNYCSGDHGGAGGNLTGGVGLSGGMNIATYGGQGGTQAAGGAGATQGGAAGTLGTGGGNGYYAGGGGGGYYGGGA
ncbi:MAG: hypothetical protein EBR91_10980, partial [Flavobacteriia bacterium]|nr:hypothetical protein [Flavobacteriia bacterium]